MGFTKFKLTPTPLIYRFTNQPIPMKGSMVLIVRIENSHHTTTIMVNFLIVDQPSTYNTIFIPFSYYY